jgi:uncharacterized protein (TIGR03067 family)
VIDPASYKDEKDKDIREDLALVSVIFEGESLTFKHPTRYEENGKRGIEMKAEGGPFRLDESTNPKQIDLLDKDSGVQAQGIYQLDGDKLKLCWDREFKTRGRPKKFTSGGRDTEPFLLMLVREKKKQTNEAAQQTRAPVTSAERSLTSVGVIVKNRQRVGGAGAPCSEIRRRA